MPPKKKLTEKIGNDVADVGKKGSSVKKEKVVKPKKEKVVKPKKEKVTKRVVDKDSDKDASSDDVIIQEPATKSDTDTLSVNSITEVAPTPSVTVPTTTPVTAPNTASVTAPNTASVTAPNTASVTAAHHTSFNMRAHQLLTYWQLQLTAKKIDNRFDVLLNNVKDINNTTKKINDQYDTLSDSVKNMDKNISKLTSLVVICIALYMILILIRIANIVSNNTKSEWVNFIVNTGGAVAVTIMCHYFITPEVLTLFLGDNNG